MKIIALETIRLDEFPNLLWVQVHTDEGLVGLGEVFYGVPSVEAYIHGSAAAQLLGQDPLRIDYHSKNLAGYIGFVGSGAEVRGNSGLDIALWDIWGQASNQPIYQLLGGASREAIRVYNTCAGYQYVRDQVKQSTDHFNLPGDRPEGPYEDLQAFLHDAGELAESLLEMGITGMKIWPFDFAAEASGGHYISPSQLDEALGPFRKIRDAVGDRMDVMVELHAFWDLPQAKKIARALEPFEPFWFEDPIKMSNLRSLKEFKDATRIPTTASETIGMRGDFRELLELQACDIVMYDLGWCGGLSEARKIAAMAEAWHRPVAPHDCTGPVLLTASVHHSINATNALIQEIVRAFYYGWYQELVTDLPPVENGMIRPPDGPGLGTRLQPGVLKRPDCHIRRSELE
ncbi:MAG: mandelate racemase/muconate lactonizing enzyme family protein [Alphaproteobacteria bacterium]|jgi:L-alanine-DL-glutamate epimerase-like enolase superfamily enzyme|nr:mandelate racemase/muconate lactonizing enzyme family protein [Alphaproteobacteria bacterium]MDP6564393.1 mandelate racemase/muconate lactonizing enzyme family protein [Alphaproteobacteria bacterium]MDP6814808.1 mandelate racemase/muconate lactonizing enzyme family protein [Alphaproteobacteria bacterium]